jgi:hypothetical protein
VTAVAVCSDVPQVADGSAYSSCANVSWIDATELPTSIFSGLDMSSGSLIAVAIMTLWALAFGIRSIVKTVNI